MLKASEAITIDKEAVLGIPPTITTPEALAFRERMDSRVLRRKAWAKRNNVKFEFQIPNDQ